MSSSVSSEDKLNDLKGRIYRVTIRRATNYDMAVRIFLYFGVLTFWLGISYTWFGGSWVINILALIAAVGVPISMKRRIGDTVSMTADEIGAWHRAGCPDSWGRDSQEP